MNDLILKLTDEVAAEIPLRVSRTPAFLGRSPECEIHLPYTGVSRRHAQIDRDASGRWCVEDLGGANGTWINGTRITARKLLSNGDVIETGTARLDVVSGAIRPADSDPASATIVCRDAIDLRSQWVGDGLSSAAAISEDIRIKRLIDLVDIAKGLNRAESIDAIFEQARQVVFRHFQFVEHFALLVDVKEKMELEVVKAASKSSGLAEEPGKVEHWLSRTICQKAFRERSAIQTANAQFDDRFDNAASIVAKNIRCAIAVPLWNDDQVVGVLYADAKVESFQQLGGAEEDLGFFCALANLVAASVQRWRLNSNLQNVEQIRRRLERYHSESVVQKMLSGGASQQDRMFPEERELTVLFADIVGFTTLSDRMLPIEVANRLNRFFEEMLGVLFEHGGTLDKYIGDCIMAFFGAPEDQPDHAQRAASTALGMLDRLAELNRTGVFVPPIEIRIAINSGPAVVGDVGSESRLEYTALGSTINQASRMEGICSPGNCVISEATYTQLPNREPWSDFGAHQFRGIERPVRIFSSARSLPKTEPDLAPI